MIKTKQENHEIPLIMHVSIPRLIDQGEEINALIDHYSTTNSNDVFKDILREPGIEGLVLLSTYSDSSRSRLLSQLNLQENELRILNETLTKLGNSTDKKSLANKLQHAFPSISTQDKRDEIDDIPSESSENFKETEMAFKTKETFSETFSKLASVVELWENDSKTIESLYKLTKMCRENPSILPLDFWLKAARKIQTSENSMVLWTKQYLAEILFDLGKPKEALTILQEIISHWTSLNDHDGFVSSSLTLGNSYEMLGMYDNAFSVYENALSICESTDDRKSLVLILGKIAELKTIKGDIEESLQLHKENLEIIEKIGDKREKAITLGDIARIKVNLGEVEEALRLHLEAKNVYEELGDRRSKAVTLGDIARIKTDKGEVEEALRLHQEELKVYEELGDRRSKAVTLGDIARIKVNQGEVEEALRLHLEAKNVFEELGDRRSKAVTLGDIARIKVNLGEVEEALRLHLEKLKIMEELGDRRSKAVTLGDIARIKVNLGEVEEALRLHLEAKDVYEELGDRRSKAVTLGDIANIKKNKGEVEEALRLQHERLKINEELGDMNEIAATYYDFAIVELQTHKFQEAFEHFSQSYTINLKLGRLDGICMAGMYLGPMLCGSGNTEQGLPILQRSFEGFVKLGQEQLAARVKEMIERFSGGA
jgi:tetratricopeptide (TPR) repeat protein